MGSVLLVEDNPLVADAVRRDLARSAFDVTVAASSGVARALEQTFDVGVFDLVLGDESGIDLAQELLSNARIGRAVFFTGASWQPLLRRAAQVGPLIEKAQGTLALLAELLEPDGKLESRPRSAPPGPRGLASDA